MAVLLSVLVSDIISSYFKVGDMDISKRLKLILLKTKKEFLELELITKW